MPGVFNEKELSKLYDPAYSDKLTDNHAAETEKAIEEFFNSYNQHLRFNHSIAGADNGFIKFDIVRELRSYSEHSLSALNSYILRRSSGDPEVQKEVNKKIRKGIEGKINYIKTKPETSIFATSSGVASMLTGQSLDNVENSVPSMFDNEEHLWTVLEFLTSVKAIANKLYMTKLFL